MNTALETVRAARMLADGDPVVAAPARPLVAVKACGVCSGHGDKAHVFASGASGFIGCSRCKGLGVVPATKAAKAALAQWAVDVRLARIAAKGQQVKAAIAMLQGVEGDRPARLLAKLTDRLAALRTDYRTVKAA